MKFDIIKRTSLHHGFFEFEAIELQHESFEGGMCAPIRRELLHRHHAAAVLPYDPVRDTVILIRQFRIGPCINGTDPWLNEIIAGYIEAGEEVEDVIHREAMEEAGCTVSDLIPIQRYYASPGSSTETIQIFAARTDTTGIGGYHGLTDEGEDIEVNVVPLDEAFAMLDSGGIGSAIPIIALQWLRTNLEMLRHRWG